MTSDKPQPVKLELRFNTLEDAANTLNKLQSDPEIADKLIDWSITPTSPPPQTFTAKPIFISYRRSDSEYITSHIRDKLVAMLGNQVFMDIYDIALGVDFTQVLKDTLQQCEVMLVIIGQTWDDTANLTRLNAPDDFVRREILAGLRKKEVRMIPILVAGRDKMPKRDDLPIGLKSLPKRNAIRIRSGLDFETDIERLVEDILKS